MPVVVHDLFFQAEDGIRDVVRTDHESTAGREVLGAPPVASSQEHQQSTQECGNATVRPRQPSLWSSSSHEGSALVSSVVLILVVGWGWCRDEQADTETINEMCSSD